jgi:prepilin-type N-terminal cleavage/methylation domain-containing protein
MTGDSNRATQSGRAGFTLVEVIVTLLIVGIVVAMSVSFLTTGSNFLGKTEENASDRTSAERAASFIKERLLYASDVEVVKSDTLPSDLAGRDILFIGNDSGTETASTGRLFYWRALDKAPVDVLGSDAYRNSELALEYKAVVRGDSDDPDAPAVAKSAVFEADVMVIRDGKRTQEAKQIFRMFNIGADSHPNEDEEITSWADGDEHGAHVANYYLLITQAQEDYVTAGLIARFDAINNAIDSKGRPVHNPLQKTKWTDLSGNGYDMDLTFTGDNSNPVRGNVIYFDGDGDLGTLGNLQLKDYTAVTFEICFREANDDKTMMLFEYAPDDRGTDKNGWHSDNGTFGARINSGGSFRDSAGNVKYDPEGANYVKGEVNSAVRVGVKPAGIPVTSRNFYFNADSTQFKTFSFVMSSKPETYGRMVFIDGAKGDGTGVDFIDYSHLGKDFTTTKSTTSTDMPVDGNGTPARTNDVLAIAARLSANPTYYQGGIASVRIYGRILSADEIAKNAAEDKARFGA